MYTGLSVLRREECATISGMWSVAYFDRFHMTKHRHSDIVLSLSETLGKM